MLPTGLVVVEDTGRGGQDDDAERTGGEQLLDPLLDSAKRNVEPGADDTALVDTAQQLDHDLARAVVVDLLELADVACEIRTNISRGSLEGMFLLFRR